MALPVLPVIFYVRQVGFYRFLGPLDGESLDKLRKSKKKSIFQTISMVGCGHFQTLKMFLKAKYGTPCTPSEVI